MPITPDQEAFFGQQASDLDIDLPVRCSDQTYLATLNHWLNMIDKEAGNTFDMIFFQAGVDILDDANQPFSTRPLRPKLNHNIHHRVRHVPFNIYYSCSSMFRF